MTGKTEQDRPPAGRQAASPAEGYALGYSQTEFKRLEMQALLLKELTADVLRRAGLAPGMRVLDLGCGVGDVSLLAADLVGPSGHVLGIDRSADMVSIAKRRADHAGKGSWVEFRTAELDSFDSARTFDAVIGRLVLMYLPDPAAALRRLLGFVVPGGLAVFHEMAMPMSRSVPEGPLFRRSIDWLRDTFRAAGFETDMGSKLAGTFVAAGLPQPQLTLGGIAGSGPDTPVHNYLVGTLRSLLPMGERFGVFTAAEADLDTLGERLLAEAESLGACMMPPPLVGAWARKAAGV